MVTHQVTLLDCVYLHGFTNPFGSQPHSTRYHWSEYIDLLKECVHTAAVTASVPLLQVSGYLGSFSVSPQDAMGLLYDSAPWTLDP